MINSQDRAIRTLNAQITSVQEILSKSSVTMAEMRANYGSISEEIEGLDSKIGV